MNNFLYNSIEGIETYLKDLSGLNRLISGRHDAYYNRNEKLKEFVILGRWITDSCGNFGKIISDSGYQIIPADINYKWPKVIFRDEMFNLLPKDVHIAHGFSSDVPPDYAKCTVCENGWTINDAHDCVSSTGGDSKVIDANPFVGAKLVNITKLPQYNNIFPHRVHHETIRHKELDKGSDRVSKDYIIKEGDKLFATVWHFMHKECNKLDEIKFSQDEIKRLFNNALNGAFNCDNKIENAFNMIMIRNRYSKNRNDPWYRIQFTTTTGEHEILMGWRKSVINIEWEKSKKDLSHLFENENVTKGSHMIHAHGYEKAKEYLSKIIQAL